MRHHRRGGIGFAALGLSLFAATENAAQAGPLTLTCNVPMDFVGPDIVTAVDPGGIDVGVPLAFPPGTVSGNDMAQVKFHYDGDADVLYVGIDTYTIAGDVDNDGNPGGTGPILSALGGTDLPNFGGTEGFSVMFDIDQDGILDIIAGVSGTTSLAGFSVNTFIGSEFAPSFAYGVPLASAIGGVCGSPSAGGPDVEFTIQNWSTLPTSSGSDASTNLNFTAFVGSLSDAGIGEDFNPGAGSTTTIPVGYCGDGRTGPGEQCDDGGTASGDGCSSTCVIEFCGDGIVQPSEQCDDGNGSDTDLCTTACEDAACGDGFVQPGEQCDDGNPDPLDGCTTVCTVAACGDGIVQVGEECDDGNEVDGDSCASSCEVEESICADASQIYTYTVTNQSDGNRVFWMNKLYGSGTTLIAVNPGATFTVDWTTGIGTFEGSGFETSQPSRVWTFTVDYTFRGVGADGVGTAGPLFGSYIPTPEEVGVWLYWDMLDATMTRNNGDYVQITMAPTDGSKPMQMGRGANFFDSEWGFANWLEWEYFTAAGTKLRKGKGDINADIEIVPPPCVCGDGEAGAGEACDDGDSDNTDGCTTACELPECGDGYVQAGEACDDGNDNNADGCTTACAVAVCGDGFVQPGEACDDGDADSTDGCTTACELPECGDGYVQAGEACDDGDTDNGDFCTTACELAECGDGYLQAGEACDDGNLATGDGCDASCEVEIVCDDVTVPATYTVTNNTSGWGLYFERLYGGADVNMVLTSASFDILWSTGEGVLSGTAYEQGNPANTWTFTYDYSFRGLGPSFAGSMGPFFGTYRPSPTELAAWTFWNLDGGTLERGDGAFSIVVGETTPVPKPTQLGKGANLWDSSYGFGNWLSYTLYDGMGAAIRTKVGDVNASITPLNGACVCGDGELDAGESCDDGNLINTDACTTSCEPPRCGDGYMQAGEECDDGDYDTNDECTNFCTIAECGDGIVGPGESCDDGNEVDTDACRNDCQDAVCGDGVVGPGEACDDGNQDPSDACTSWCTDATCGDGVVGPGEACDDGDLDDNDGCTATCEPTVICEDLGVGQDYNVLLFGDYIGGVDLGGKLAAAGDVRMENFAINYSTPGGVAVVAGGHLDLKTGNVFGDGFYAGSEDVDNVSFLGGDLYQGMPINFAFVEAKANQLCGQMEALPTNGATVVQSFPGVNLITLNGADGAVNTFDLDAATLADAGSLAINTPAGSTTIVKLSGSVIEFRNFGTMLSGTDPHHILWVTCDATDIDIYAFGFKGSLLAPTADITFNNAAFDGTLIAKNASGNGEFHSWPFLGELPCPTCGNGTIEAPETCDDGDLVSGDGCGATCRVEGCGDGYLQAGEECDDGNGAGGDGCSATCENEYHPACGDGILTAGEECDDANLDDDDGCSAGCAIEFCGDGVVQTGESCDDANPVSGDGCDSSCELESGTCGNGWVDAGEGCDDGDLHDGDGCSSICQPEAAYCGDGVLQAGEQCDDGNDVAGDGCSEGCFTEDCVPGLGTAAGFNLFVASTYRDGQDVAGPVAAGELIRLRGFSVGFAVPGGPVMVGGDTIDVDTGSIWGDAFYGSTLSWGGPTTVGFPTGGSLQLGAPIDFGAAMDHAGQLSFALHALAANGSTASQWGMLELTGTDPDFNVIDVDADDLSHAHTIAIYAPAGATVVVNVRGYAADISNKGMFLDGAVAENVLFNFSEATSIQMGGLGFQGSILAPYADVNFYNGQILGQVVAYNLFGNVELYWRPWSGNLDCASWEAFKAAQLAAGTWGSTF